MVADSTRPGAASLVISNRSAYVAPAGGMTTQVASHASPSDPSRRDATSICPLTSRHVRTATG